MFIHFIANGISLHSNYNINKELESQTFKETSAQWLDYNTQQQNKIDIGIVFTVYRINKGCEENG